MVSLIRSNFIATIIIRVSHDTTSLLLHVLKTEIPHTSSCRVDTAMIARNHLKCPNHLATEAKQAIATVPHDIHYADDAPALASTMPSGILVST